MTGLLLLAGAWAAAAGPTVIAAPGDTDDATRAVARSTTTRAPVPAALGTTTAGGPAVQVFDAPLGACTGTPIAPGTLTDALVRAARQVDYVEYADALATTDAALASLPCLTGPLPAPTVARLAFLSGIVLYEEGEAAAAQRAFGMARRVQPDLAWDTAFAPDARDLFEAATPPAATAPLVVFPARVATWVDGAAWMPGTSVAPGEHLLQLRLAEGTWTRSVVVPPEGLQVVVSDRLTDGDLVAVEQPQSGAALARTLASAHGAVPLVWFDDALWRWERTGWQRHAPSRVPRRLPAALTGTGLAVTAVSAPLFATAWARARGAWTDGSGAGTWAEFREARGRYRVAKDTLGWSRWVLAGGLGLVGTGQVLGARRRRAQLTPLVGPSGLGLQVDL